MIAGIGGSDAWVPCEDPGNPRLRGTPTSAIRSGPKPPPPHRSRSKRCSGAPAGALDSSHPCPALRPTSRVHAPVQRCSDNSLSDRHHSPALPAEKSGCRWNAAPHRPQQSRVVEAATRPRAREAVGGFVVTVPVQNGGMEPAGCIQLWGRGQRYVLTELLFDHGPLRVAEIVALLHAEGLVIGGRPSKTVSDALGWEVAHGRVVRLGRGLYGPGRMPRSTRAWIRRRNRLLRAQRICPLGRPAAYPPLDDACMTHHPGPAACSSAIDPAGGPTAGSPTTRAMTETDAPTHNLTPALPVTRPVAPGPASCPVADPPPHHPNNDTTHHHRRRTGPDEVVVLGAGWNEDDEAAEDARLRKQLLTQLGWTGS